MSVRGFILQPTYRIEGGRPMVLFFGRLENGEPFLVRDDRQIPHFYIEDRHGQQARELGAEHTSVSDRRNFADQPVLRVNVRLPSDIPALRDRLTENGIPCYESDLRFPMRLLMDRGIRGAMEIEGAYETSRHFGRIYTNPQLKPARWKPTLSVLSIDIETDPRARRLLSIALYGCGTAEVLLFNPKGYEAPPDCSPFPHERDVLRAFCRRVQELDPDVIIGWNVIDFDFRVLDRMAKSYGLPFELGRGPGVVRLRSTRSPWGSTEATIPGRVVLDGVRLLRSSFIKMDRYSLDAVAKEVLGEGKTLHGQNRAGEILATFKHERQRFVEYNLTDTRLALEILEKLNLVDLAVERSLLTGLPIDRVAGSIAAFDFLYLSELERRKIVAPNVGANNSENFDGEINLGGHVLEPESGLYRHVLVFDFKSLYPSLIRTFQIDPLGYLPNPAAEEDSILAPNGAAFRRQPGILPRLLDELFPRREKAKQANDPVASHAIKILMNSFYGVLGTTACRFYRPQLATAITSFGREILLWSKRRFEDYGYRVLYGDTDSLFVLSGADEAATALAHAERLLVDLNRDLAAYIKNTWNVDSRLELEFERLYQQLHLPFIRGGRGGARKRYVGQVGEGEEMEIIFTGMEVVRRDWTELAKRVQRELYQRLFSGEPLDQYLSLVVSSLRQGHLDELLIYRKALRKNLDEYTATTPPHVAAARKMAQSPGRLISYVMTTQGAEPAEERSSPIDHEHYVQKQIRPVAEPVLELRNLEFDKVVGDDVQLTLFD